MRYAEYPPAPELAPWIRCYWSLNASRDGSETGGSERVVPDGCMEIIFHHGDRFVHRRASGEEDLQGRAFVCGQIERFMELAPTGKTGIFAIRFQPMGAHPFLGIPVCELTGETVGLNRLSPDGGAFAETLLEANGDTSRIRLADRYLKRRLADAEDLTGRNTVRAAVGFLASSDAVVRTKAIAATLGTGERQLRRLFQRWVGLSPKRVARILRFQSAVRAINRPAMRDWAGLAVDCGYYDQAHFIHEFKAMAGESPGAFARNHHAMAKQLAGS